MSISKSDKSDSPTTPASPTDTLALSIVVPIYNEVESIGPLYDRLTEVLVSAEPHYRDSYEIVFVDDGSDDGSFEACAAIQKDDLHVMVVQFRRNFGKTAALHAGFQHSIGTHIVTIDADMQEDPGEMFALLAELNRGADLVSGWRTRRNDPISKTWPSRIFNAVVSTITGVRLHDFNCGFKAYKRDVLRSLDLYGEQHRFIPLIAHERGYRVREVPIAHQARRFGRSKFGWGRLGRGYLDFLQVLFITTYMRRPLRLFGTIGTLLIAMGLVFYAYLAWLWALGERPIGDRPLLILGVLLVISGLQFVSTGLVSEMVRHSSYHASDDYAVRTILRGSNDIKQKPAVHRN
jgi:glycosyltransferase involved in cell wall biosynthesis